MKLKIKDRILLSNILPQKGNMVTLTISKELSDKIKLTTKEIEEKKIKSNEAGSLTWSQEKDVDIEFKLSDLEVNLIKEELKRLDDSNELTMDYLDLYKLING